MTSVIPRGFLFALDPHQAAAAASCLDTADLRAGLRPLWGSEWAVEVDRAWEDIHLALAKDDPDGVLGRALLGGLRLAGVPAARLVVAEEVGPTARALARIDFDDFRERFLSCLTGEPDEEEDEMRAAYTWSWFLRLRALFQAAADQRRAVLFTAGLSLDAVAAVTMA